MVQADKTVSCRRGEALPAATAMGADWTLSTSSLRPPGGPLWLLPSDGSFQCGFCSTRKHLKLSISLRNVLVSYVNVLCINKKTYWFTFIYLYILEKRCNSLDFHHFHFKPHYGATEQELVLPERGLRSKSMIRSAVVLASGILAELKSHD